MSEETAEKEGIGSHGQRREGLETVKDAAAISFAPVFAWSPSITYKTVALHLKEKRNDITKCTIFYSATIIIIIILLTASGIGNENSCYLPCYNASGQFRTNGTSEGSPCMLSAEAYHLILS
jgi:hypothetical protein